MSTAKSCRCVIDACGIDRNVGTNARTDCAVSCGAACGGAAGCVYLHCGAEETHDSAEAIDFGARGEWGGVIVCDVAQVQQLEQFTVTGCFVAVLSYKKFTVQRIGVRAV